MIDIVVVGAGFCGSLAAILLDGMGYRVTVVDRYATFPAFFAAEQLVGSQTKTLDDMGVLQNMVAGVPLVARALSYSLNKQHVPRLSPHYGLPYQDMVRSLRAQIPLSVPFVAGRAVDVSHDPQPVVHLDDGRTLRADLVVMATGLNNALSRRLGLRQEMVSRQHSTTIGFDMEISAFAADDTPILCFYGADRRDRVDYLAIFRYRGGLRGNLFAYRAPDDPWVRAFRQQPASVLEKALPQLRRQVGPFAVSQVDVRASDVAVVSAPELPGIVLVGDAFQTPCPAAGTGIDRLLVDLQRLVAHVPQWVAAGNFSSLAIASFYADEAKRASDARALRAARLRRGMTVEAGLAWDVYRRYVNLRRLGTYVVDRTRQAMQAPPAGEAMTGMAPLKGMAVDKIA